MLKVGLERSSDTSEIAPEIAFLDERVLRSQTTMFDLGELDVQLDAEARALWVYMAPTGLPNLSNKLINNIITLQTEITRVFSQSPNALKYLVFGSKYPNIFNLGGDLELFVRLIETQDSDGLRLYTRKCIEIFNRTVANFDLPIVSIALCQGDTFGGGFEAALSFNVIVAEKGVKFALPEASFGLFPAVGAHVQLVRLLGAAQAQRMMISGRSYSAEELYDMGLVHTLAEPGEGMQAVQKFIKKSSSVHTSYTGIYNASKQVNPVSDDELERIADIWTACAAQLSDQNIKLMKRIAATQARMLS